MRRGNYGPPSPKSWEPRPPDVASGGYDLRHVRTSVRICRIGTLFAHAKPSPSSLGFPATAGSGPPGRAYQPEQPDPPSEQAVVAAPPAAPGSPLEPPPPLYLVLLLGEYRPKIWTHASWGWFGQLPRIRPFNNHMALMRGAARSEGQKKSRLESCPPAHHLCCYR